MILNWVDNIFYALSWDDDLTSWQSQMSSKTMKQIMLMKYYNQTMNLNSDKTITELWDIYHREKNDDQKINKSADSFQVSLKTVLMQIYS